MSGDGRDDLLILNRTQFGYHLDTYYYAKFAAERLRITYVGFDVGNPRLALDGAVVKYVGYKGCRCRRYLRLLAAFAREVRRCRGVVFINYFPGCTMLRCCGRHVRMVVDIRTGSIHPNAFVRRWEDRLMRWECRLFRNISVVSQGLADRLHLPSERVHILPLGAERLTLPARRFDRFDLLYVGTLDGRRIEDTVIGFGRFLRDYGDRMALTYTIVGGSHNGQLERLTRMVRQHGLDGVVHLPGYTHQTRLRDMFERCNIGVSYVPINDIYDRQPVTKTFEYLLAGMPVIATATTEHRKVVNRLNGVLIQDTPEDFYQGLKQLYDRRQEFDSEAIRHCCPEASWDRIVHRNLIPYIQTIRQSRLP